MVLLGVLSGLYGIVKAQNVSKPITDTTVFQLHYRWTRLLLFTFCVIVSLNSLVGDPIVCMTSHKNDQRQKVLETYCWISGTFTLEKYHSQQNRIDDSLLSTRGIGPGDSRTEEKKHIGYYQWVPFVLFLQGVLFYVPHWIWKMFEQHRLRQLMEGMVEPTTEEKKRQERQRKVINYLLDTKGTNEWYAYEYIFCEILNFINVMLNLALVDKFLGGDFWSYVPKLLTYDPLDVKAIDPTHYTFPKVTKCSFQDFGPSNTLQQSDVLCILSANIFSEKLYAFLWFWLVFLACVTLLDLLWRVATIISPVLRVWILQNKGHVSDVGGMHVVTQVVNNLSFSDFFFVWLFTKNMNGLVLFDFLREYARTLASSAPPKKLYPTLPHVFEMQPRATSVDPNYEDVKKPLTPESDGEEVMYARVRHNRRD